MWEMTHVLVAPSTTWYEGKDRELNELLEWGWEPFAVTENDWNRHYATVWLRRKKEEADEREFRTL